VSTTTPNKTLLRTFVSQTVMRNIKKDNQNTNISKV